MQKKTKEKECTVEDDDAEEDQGKGEGVYSRR